MSPPFHVEASSTPASLPSRPPDPCTIVLFGATGDLAHRKIVPALYSLARCGDLPSPFGVVATSTSVGPSEAYRAQLRQSVERFSGGHAIDGTTWAAFAGGIDTVAGDYTKPEAWMSLRAPAVAKTHVVEAEVVSADATAKTLTIKAEPNKTVTVEGAALAQLKDLKMGEKVKLTCRDNDKGEHQAITDIKVEKAPAKK